jgi:DNA replication protein DnaC
MTDLINSFDSYKDFNRHAYFTVCFGTLASGLLAEVAIEGNKENMEKVIELIDLNSIELEVVFKKWMTEDDKDSELSSDYVFEYIFKSESNRLIVWVSLDNNYLNVDFLYDVSNTVTEKWVISTNHKLRTSLGENKSPTFKILSKSNGSFRTKEVKLEKFDFDANKTYNDNFSEVNDIILSSLEKSKAGLILLHGKPGTGKTSYIKNLINTHAKKTFIFIQNEFVSELLDPEFISFLLKHKDSILIIEDAEKVITTREQANENSVVSTILQLTDGLFSDYLNVKIICTFNTSIEKIDKALLRKGRMIAYYDFQALTKEKTNLLLKSLGAEPTDKELTLAEIFNFQTKEFNQSSKRNPIGF